MTVIDDLESAFLSLSRNFLTEKGSVRCTQVKDTTLLELVLNPPLSPRIDHNRHVEKMFEEMQFSDLRNGLGESVTLGGDPTVANSRHITVRFQQGHLSEVITSLRGEDSAIRERLFLHSMFERVESMLLDGVDPKRILAALTVVNAQWKNNEAVNPMPVTSPESATPQTRAREVRGRLGQLDNFKAELHGQIGSLINQQGSDRSNVLDEVQLVMNILDQAINSSKSKGGAVIQNWAEITRRPIPPGQGKNSYGRE